MGLPPDQYQSVTWRDGTNGALTSRFTCLRVRPAHQSHLTTAMRPEEWLLIEWPQGGAEPAGYWLATAPPNATLEQFIFVAKMRWRIERDYRALKQEFGLSHYEGRNWRDFHHPATLWRWREKSHWIRYPPRIAQLNYGQRRRLIRRPARRFAAPRAPAADWIGPGSDTRRCRP